MKIKLPGLMLAAATTCYSAPPLAIPPDLIQDTNGNVIADITRFARTGYHYLPFTDESLSELRTMLHREAVTLNPAVIDKVITSLKCACQYHVDHNAILTVIDYSLPSSEKRLWVFDLQQGKLLFNTYVSHGIKSGELLSNYFSNKYNSKASSIGVYKTNKSYFGREGLSLRLSGLDRQFNDNAENRSVVMHGGWYVEEQFIKKYGRAGRSWGCPALPLSLYQPIINAIKNDSFMVVYYPSDAWFVKSRFLNCDSTDKSSQGKVVDMSNQPTVKNDEPRNDIVYADLNRNNRREESEPIAVMEASRYESRFQSKAPLERMLRRQINHQEYIALTPVEFGNLINTKSDWTNVSFVIPVIIMKRGYYETEMHFVDMGNIKEITPIASQSGDNNNGRGYTVSFDKKSSVKLSTSYGFIRWLGL